MSTLKVLNLIVAQLNDKSLLKQECYINGSWSKAKSGETFDVHGLTVPPPSIDLRLIQTVQTPRAAH